MHNHGSKYLVLIIYLAYVVFSLLRIGYVNFCSMSLFDFFRMQWLNPEKKHHLEIRTRIFVVLVRNAADKEAHNNVTSLFIVDMINSKVCCMVTPYCYLELIVPT